MWESVSEREADNNIGGLEGAGSLRNGGVSCTYEKKKCEDRSCTGRKKERNVRDRRFDGREEPRGIARLFTRPCKRPKSSE